MFLNRTVLMAYLQGCWSQLPTVLPLPLLNCLTCQLLVVNCRKSSLVVLIPKNSDPSNYRPISLLPVLSKVLEHHMSNLLYDHILVHSPISTSQWGFLPGRSTTDAVLSATHEWHQILDSGSEVCSIFFDLQKAFDSVPHRSLIAKLSQLLNINISYFLLKWIVYNLTHRSQCVGVEGATSPPLPVLSGVPQGSVLGLLYCL